jgi:hypothetical protein
MIDWLGRTLSGLILLCKVAMFSAIARRNRAELWSGLGRVGDQPLHGLWRQPEPISSARLVPVKANVPRGTFALWTPV